ncbi:thioredoxin family protein [Pseudomonadota bacterium]
MTVKRNQLAFLALSLLVLLIPLLVIPPAMAANQLSEQESAFLKRHWPATIPLQGQAPSGYSKLEASLHPESCGTCHTKQYEEWQTTLHAKAMGPGLLGQLVEMVDSDPASAKMCWSCHTPLAEQQDKLFTADGWKPNPAFDKELQHKGLVCAACHVRNHQRIAPPRKNLSNQNHPPQLGKIFGDLPHNGFSAETAFTKSGFCKGCHQFTENDYALNGKLIENTYNEWLASDYPKKDVQCQTCHMPDRQHIWRGIHDPDMTKKGVTVNITTEKTSYRKGETVEATIRVTNSGTGHYFPTYLTPRIEVNAYLVNAQGDIQQASLQQAVIAREVTLDLSQELFDTRIPPGETLAIGYSHLVAEDYMQLRVEATVYPDYFYTRFYESMLNNRSAGRGTKIIEQALEDSNNSTFILFEKTLPLAPNAAELNIESLKPSQVKAPPPATHSNVPDWNPEEIQWFEYEQGLQEAQKSGKAIMLIFYADWCPTCHAYKHIFSDPHIVEQSKSLVMIRANVDQSPDIAKRYNDDGEYVPRIYALNAHGDKNDTPFAQRSYPKHFARANAVEDFLQLMRMTAKN